jgi:hypothetical protein
VAPRPLFTVNCSIGEPLAMFDAERNKVCRSMFCVVARRRRFKASEEAAAQAVMELAAGTMDEPGYSAFLRSHSMIRSRK